VSALGQVQVCFAGENNVSRIWECGCGLGPLLGNCQPAGRQPDGPESRVPVRSRRLCLLVCRWLWVGVSFSLEASSECVVVVIPLGLFEYGVLASSGVSRFTPSLGEENRG
jgi:hypothetical protein